jgi:cell division protease FtsH
VPPAPRGSSPTPTPGRSPRFRLNRNWTLFFLALLALNIFLGSRAMREPPRPRVPYSPYFLQQVRDGHVKTITSKGTAIQGTFTQKQQYGDSKPSDRFKTEIPAFADNDALTKLLQSEGVVVNAQPLETGSPWWQSILLLFGPTILFDG